MVWLPKLVLSSTMKKLDPFAKQKEQVLKPPSIRRNISGEGLSRLRCSTWNATSGGFRVGGPEARLKRGAF